MPIRAHRFSQWRTFRWAILFALGLNACLVGQAASGAEVNTQLFQQPSLPSALASESLMLDVALAGQRLVAVGERGFILLSEDEGQSWRQVPSPVSVTLTRVVFPSATQGWAVGHAGVVLHSSDGGLSWSKQLDGEQAARLELEAAQHAHSTQPSEQSQQRVEAAQLLFEEGPDKPFLAVHFFDEQQGVILGAYGLAFATADGGASWQSIRERLDNPSAMHLYDIHELAGELFIAGEQGLLLRSVDHGLHFAALESPANGTLFGLLATDAQGLLAFGLRGKTYLSEDHGDSWRTVPNSLPVTLTAGARLADGSLMLVDESGRTLLSRDHGHSFVASILAKPAYLTGLTSSADGQVILASNHGLARLADSSAQRSPGSEQ
ncbi:WD40/YVTN/BNR-like repeat-containing protein [Pseudomonas tumuqii]|uniref:WD40/YVTN/BNR-like repeat-containing protein n=1 Tax=Pseudomonas tumuqii TaxID=2715755 RepID=UPI001554EC2D|nr:YCF48-related protein [Pseudomonas tumuqii]